jgi:hypothetical protein
MKISLILAVMLILNSAVAVSAAVYVVDTNNPAASDGNVGNALKPLKTIAAAVAKVKAGDIVSIKSGVYREQFEIKASGTAGKPITIEAAPGETVVMDEADNITGWQKYDDKSGRPLWQKAPFNKAEAFPVVAEGWSNRTQLLVDNMQYAQVEHPEQLYPGSFYVDPSGSGSVTLWPLPPKSVASKIAAGAEWWQAPTNLASDDVNTHDVEIATRTYGILATDQGYITIRGIIIRHGATSLGLVFGGDYNPCHDIVLDHCTVEDAAAALGARGNNFLITHCYFHDNGLGSGAGFTNSVMEDTVFDHNTSYGSAHGNSAGGIKLLWTYKTIIRRCQFINNDGPGIWFDTGNADNIIEQNFCSYNSGPGIMMEVSPDFASVDPAAKPVLDGWAPRYMGIKPGGPAGPNILRNNICVGNRFDGSSGSGILLQLASDEIVVNNTLVGNAMYGIFARYHPYNDWTHRLQNDTLMNNLCVDNGGSQIFITEDPIDKPGIVAGNKSDYNMFFETATWLNQNESTGIRDYVDRSAYGQWGKTENDFTYSVDETYKIRGYEQHSIQGDPFFISRSTLDFGLQSCSPAIGAGIATPYVTDDYLGRPRPFGAPPTIGALEYIPGPQQPPAMPMQSQFTSPTGH